MREQKHSALDEIIALKEKFNMIKEESEEFVSRAKKLSDSGMHEAKDLLEAAKTNWHAMTGSLVDFTKLFSKSSKPARKVGSRSKKASKKKTKKVSKLRK